MRKIVVFLLWCFLCFVAWADTISLHWLNENASSYAETTCTVGGNLILPTAPTKRGYTFVGWTTPDFQLVEYIEATGTQWIDTGIVQGRFVHDIAFTQKNNVNLMGAGSGSGQYWGQSRSSTDGFELGPLHINADSSVRRSVEFNNLNTSVSLTIDGQTITRPLAGAVAPYSVFHIYNSSEYFCSAKLWGLKVYDSNNVLIGNFLPVQRKSDGVIGLYDTVTQSFKTNQGTGTFVAGSTIE